MVSITLSVSEETRKYMKRFNEVNWSSIVRTAIESRIKKELWKEEMLRELEAEKEEGYEKMALELGDKVKRNMWEKYKEKGW